MGAFSTSSLLSVAGVIAVVACLVKVVKYFNAILRKSSFLKKFPHDPLHWFWGNMTDLPGEPDGRLLELQRDLNEKYPNNYALFFGPWLPSIILNSPPGIKTILKTADPKGFLYHMLKPWLGDGLLLSSGNKWARNRRLLTPAFHFEILKPYLNIKNKAADIFCSKVMKFAEKKEYFEECSLVAMFTLDVILQCAFSYETNCQDTGTSHPYVMAVTELGRILATRFLNPVLHFDWIFYLTPDGRSFTKHCNFVHNIAEEVIARRKKTLEQKLPDVTSRKRCTDFLDILLMARDENDTGLTDKDIRDEVDTFLFEGHDTTSSAISWTLYSIAQHGEIQDKIQKEIDQLFDGRETDDILPGDLKQLPYLTMCLKESLRLHSVVPFIIRNSSQDIEIEGNILPKDTMTNINIYALHHNQNVWKDSLDFIPERFSPDNIETMNPFAYIPFSAGSRNCIGQNFAMHEIKALVVKVFHRFFLEIDPDHNVDKLETVVMRAKNGIYLKATQRKAGEFRFD